MKMSGAVLQRAGSEIFCSSFLVNVAVIKTLLVDRYSLHPDLFFIAKAFKSAESPFLAISGVKQGRKWPTFPKTSA